MKFHDELSWIGRVVWRWAHPRRFLLFSFLFPLLLRTIPELLAGPWPLGFDTVWVYAPFVKRVETQGAVSSLGGVLGSQTAPLMFFLLASGALVTRAAPFAVTKAAAPVLYGFLGFSLYYFGRRGLGWSQPKSLWLVLISALYFVPLLFSWGLYKNTLGLSFFFLALPHAQPSLDRRQVLILTGFSALSILSEELMAVLVAGTFGVLLLWGFLKDRQWDRVAMALSLVGLFATFFYVHLIVPPVLPASPLAIAASKPHILNNYVGSNADLYTFPSLTDMYLSVFSLTGILSAPILPLAAFGFFRERRLLSAAFVLGTGSFSILISPYAALPVWHRWLYMLVFLGLIFATVGFLRMSRRGRIAFLVVLLFLGIAYIGPPDGGALPYFNTPYTLDYLPPSLMRNTVGLQDCPEVVHVMTWLNDQHPSNSVVVADIWFVGWAELYAYNLSVYAFTNPLQVNNGNFTGFGHVYVLGWAVGEGGFQRTLLPAGAIEIFVSGRIAIYEIGG